MSTSKHIDKICIILVVVMLLLTVLFMCGEYLGIEVIKQDDENERFSQNDLNSDWQSDSATQITFSGDSAKINGNGAYFANGNVHIIYAGKYILSGELSNGSIIVDADGDDKIWLMMNGVSLNCDDNAAIIVEQADNVYLTLKSDTENTIKTGKEYSFEAKQSGIDGAIYSRDDLTINGSGKLSVTAEYSHGIVCNDDLKITGGNINVTSEKDAFHANDSVRIRKADVTLTAGDDGITASNDDRSDYIYVESGNVNITKCYEGLEANTVSVVGGNVSIVSSDDGVNAESLIEILGGTVRVENKTGRDADGFDSNKDIVISGGNVFISVSQSGGSGALDYGSERGGTCKIDGGTVVACGGSMMLEEISSDSKQAFVIKSVSGVADSKLTITDSQNNVLVSETIPADFNVLTFSSDMLSQNDKCTLAVNDTKTEITMNSEMDSAIQSGGRGGMNPSGNFGGGMQNNDNQNTDSQSAEQRGMRNFDENGTPPEKPDGDNGGTPPEKPDGDMPSDNPFEQADSTNVDNSKRQKFENKQGLESASDIQKSDKDSNSVKSQTDNIQTQVNTIDTYTLIVLGASIILLLVGLLIAVKKK